jgi:cephalosporin hydroxylase
MGVPIIQFPQDMAIMQELIWDQKPDLIIETGIAHGGSLVFYASIMELIGKGRIIGIDVDIRSHNKKVIESHPMAHRIKMIEGSSVDKSTISKVKSEINDAKKIMVCLDSKHTHDHVLKELNLYSSFVTKGSYIVVFDTTAQIFDEEVLTDLAKNYQFSPWGKDSNPHSALHEFLEKDDDFEIDKDFHLKAMITNCFEGFLKKK